MTFGSRLKALRNERGMTQQELADVFFVSRQAVTKWETDRSLPDSETIFHLAEFFNVTVEYLLEGKVYEEPYVYKNRALRISYFSIIVLIAACFFSYGLIWCCIDIHDTIIRNNKESIYEESFRYFTFDNEYVIDSFDDLKKYNLPYILTGTGYPKDKVEPLNQSLALEYNRFSTIYAYDVKCRVADKDLLISEPTKYELTDGYDSLSFKSLYGDVEFYEIKPLKEFSIKSFDLNMSFNEEVSYYLNGNNEFVNKADNQALYSSINIMSGFVYLTLKYSDGSEDVIEIEARNYSLQIYLKNSLGYTTDLLIINIYC